MTKDSSSGFVRTGRIAGTSRVSSQTVSEPGRVKERRERLPKLAEIVDALKARGMSRGIQIGLKDSVECFGVYDVWSTAVPVTFSRWTGLKHRKGGKPRGISVNRGNKWKGIVDD